MSDCRRPRVQREVARLRVVGFRDKIKRRASGSPRTYAEFLASSLLLGELREEGWHESVRCRVPRTRGGRPIPWWTYAANAWLDLALRGGHRVFEFGSGGSTIWLAGRTREVHSVEHDRRWAQSLRQYLPQNVHYHEISSGHSVALREADYLQPLHETSGDFDLVVIDGEARVSCALAATDRVGATGLILLDDADRLMYRSAHEHLLSAGFGRLDFFGPRPGVGHLSTTSVFSRDIRPWMRDLSLPTAYGY